MKTGGSRKTAEGMMVVVVMLLTAVGRAMGNDGHSLRCFDDCRQGSPGNLTVARWPHTLAVQVGGAVAHGDAFTLSLANQHHRTVAALRFEAVRCKELAAGRMLFRIHDLGRPLSEAYYTILSLDNWMALTLQRRRDEVVVVLKEPLATLGGTSTVALVVNAEAPFTGSTRLALLPEGERPPPLVWDDRCLQKKSTSSSHQEETEEKVQAVISETLLERQISSLNAYGSVTVPKYVIVIVSICGMLVLSVAVLVATWQYQHNKLRRRRCSHQQQLMRKSYEKEKLDIEEQRQRDLDLLRRSKPPTNSSPNPSLSRFYRLQNIEAGSPKNKESRHLMSRQVSENSHIRCNKMDKRFSQISDSTVSTCLGGSSGSITPIFSRSKDNVKASKTDIVSETFSNDSHYDRPKKLLESNRKQLTYKA